jgi:phosphatidylserine/phosphatidylglycerophosphate/cardiolipin synthase-like enzyme
VGRGVPAPDRQVDAARKRDAVVDADELLAVHDLQMAVDGEAAARLGEIARERWRAATGEVLEPPANAMRSSMQTSFWWWAA